MATYCSSPSTHWYWGSNTSFQSKYFIQIVGPGGGTAITKPSVLQSPMALWGLDILSQIESEFGLIFNRGH